MTLATEQSIVPVLLYHSINDRPATGQDAFTVAPRLFSEHVRAISDAGCTGLTLHGLAAAVRGECDLPPRPVVVTFDDGFADSRPAVELLLNAGLKASVFVTSGSLGGHEMLTPAGVRGLAALGGRVEVGAHSVSHPRLDELNPTRVAEEISNSKAALEELLQSPPKSFAYPHGAHDQRVRAAVIAAGFSAAAAVKNALSHIEDDPYALARITIMGSTTANGIETLLSGSGVPLAWGRERLRTRGYRSVRRLRRRLELVGS